MTKTLTWDPYNDFSKGPNVEGRTLDRSTNASNGGNASFTVDVNYNGNQYGTDAEASVNNYNGNKISYNQSPGEDVRTNLGTLSLNGGDTVKIVVDSQSDLYSKVAVYGPNGLSATANSNDEFNQPEKNVEVYYNYGSLTGNTKAFGDGLFEVKEVTLDGYTNSNTGINANVYDDSGSGEYYYSLGTHTDTSGLSPTSSLSVDVDLDSSDGFSTPGLYDVTVVAEPVVQVYQNGNWVYKPIRVLSGNGSTDDVKDVERL